MSQKLRENVLSVSDRDSCGQLLHALVGLESKKPVVSIPPIPLNDIEPEPRNYEDVMNSEFKDVWEDAMARELEGLKATGTFTFTPAPADRKAIGSKWVFRWKSDQSGHVTKAKAKLVARGFSQIEGVDYLETFAPTPAAPSVRLLAAVACEHDMDTYHFDAEQAFVQSKLEEKIYMKLPPDCGGESGLVVRLSRSLYGFK